MKLDLYEKGKGEIEIVTAIPENMQLHLIHTANPVLLKGVHFTGLLQEFKGNGFSAWYSKYWAAKPSVITAEGAIPALELRIALKNLIRGSWDKIKNPVLPALYFQLGYVPHIITEAIFENSLDYETFDIHFELAFLEKIGVDYKTLQKFLNKVSKDKPAELTKFSHPCSNLMIEAVQAILHNSFSPAGKARLLLNNVTNILIAALEEVGKDEIKHLPLSTSDIDALYHVRELIDQYCPVYPGNDVLVTKARNTINAFKLSYGFKRIFGMNPYDYYLERRFLMAKDLLRKGDKVVNIANELEYESSTAFIKAFRLRFLRTPKQYQLRGD